MAADEPLAVTVREAARRLGVSRDTVRRAGAAGRLKVVRIGRLVRVTTASIRALLDGGPPEKPPGDRARSPGGGGRGGITGRPSGKPQTTAASR
jgi:excisionase family DNA binding protein